MSTTWAELAQLHFLRPWWLLALLLVPLLAWRLRTRARRRSGWREAVDAHLLPHLLEPGAAATGVPHVVQNFASSRSSELQFWHFIVVVLFG